MEISRHPRYLSQSHIDAHANDERSQSHGVLEEHLLSCRTDSKLFIVSALEMQIYPIVTTDALFVPFLISLSHRNLCLLLLRGNKRV